MLDLKHLFIAATVFLACSHATASNVVTSHGIAMHGDMKYQEGFTHFEYTNPEAPKGGSVTLAAYGTFDSFNPDIVKGDAAAFITVTYDTLMVSAMDEPFTVYGLVAEKVEYPEDRSWVIFHLNPKARFHDGHPITAEDVVFTFNTLIEHGQPFYRAYYADVVNVEALDDQRVKFTARDNKNRELPLVLGQLKVLPKHYWENRDFSAANLEVPLGSGPYKITSFDTGKSITFERVKDYWAKDLPVMRGSYNFDTIKVEYYRDQTVMLEAFKGGSYDYREENQSKRWATDYHGPRFDKGEIIKQEIPHQNPTGMQAFVMNTRNELFQDSRVRHALNLAFDFEWTNKQLFYGAYNRTQSFFSNSDLASSGLPSEAELALLEPFREDLPVEVFTQEYQSPTTDGSGNNRKNIRKAISLLKEAGWSFKGTELVHSTTGKPFKFEILLYNKDFERVVLPYIKNLKKLGIEASARVVDSTNYIRIVRDFEFDMIIGGFGQSNSPGNEQRDYWFSKFADHKGSRNLIGVKDPVVDILIEKIISAQSRADLVAACRALDRVLLWNHYVVPQWYINKHRIAYWDKFAQPEIAPIYGDVGFFNWWLKQAEASEQ
ncbi:extracellular solute-binding protein [Ketobacter sp.]|uniref:extracellular solute-binding protein n=1 Tax=Ketobacter sp. TaxID=2083498 RepID=UPI000F22299B|nr:extracellular solute-binding protein [Ketobacter sp.]RLT98661.1 MAG: ABC transporter substrate-binding protein [Ketobacter sp.]